MSIERPEAKRPDAVTPVLDSIMTFKEYRVLEHPTPYVFEAHGCGRELLYFGAHHSEDPADAMFDDLKARFETFTESHPPEDSLVVIEGGGHTWPGKEPRMRSLGVSTRDISANDMMWEFFQRHPMP